MSHVYTVECRHECETTDMSGWGGEWMGRYKTMCLIALVARAPGFTLSPAPWAWLCVSVLWLQSSVF